VMAMPIGKPSDHACVNALTYRHELGKLGSWSFEKHAQE
jgi:hypothetical protein